MALSGLRCRVSPVAAVPAVTFQDFYLLMLAGLVAFGVLTHVQK